MAFRQVIAAFLFSLTVASCNDASFSAAQKKDDPKKSSDLKKPGDGPNDPNNSGDAIPKDPTDCTAASKVDCLQKRKDEGVEDSFRSVDCKGKAKADCNAAISDERKKDDDIGSEIRVDHCADYCTDLKDVVVSDADYKAKMIADSDSSGGKDGKNGSVGDGSGGKDGKSGDISDSDGSTFKGIKVLRVGVNFEDQFDKAKSDHDYNDAVICFSGKFAVDGTNIKSLVDQTVPVTTSSISGCKHNVTAQVKGSDGSSRSSNTFSSKAGGILNFTFKKGDSLEVFMQTTSGRCSKTKVDMHNASAAIVKPDVCNTTGK